MNRLADRVLALALAVVAIGCLARVYPLVGSFAWHGASGLLADAASVRLLVFSVAALACLVGALLFWAGLLPGRPAHVVGAPLFGRAAEVQETGRPGLRKVFLALPLVVVVALAADRFGPWHDGGGEVASQPSEPKAAEPKPGESKPDEPKLAEPKPSEP